MNPNPTPPGGGEFGFSPQGPQGPPPPQGSPPQGPPPQGPPPQGPAPRGRYGTGLLAVLSVIAVLAGASFLGGGLALTGAATDRIAAAREPEPVEAEPSEEPSPEESPSSTEAPVPEPTEEPSDPPSEEPEMDLLSADEVVAELREDYDDLQEGVNISDELCEEDEEDSPFICTSAMETNLVRVVAFDNIVLSSAVIAGLRSQIGEDDNDMVDAQNACHLALIWFEDGNMDEGERGAMVGDVEDIVGC